MNQRMFPCSGWTAVYLFITQTFGKTALRSCNSVLGLHFISFYCYFILLCCTDIYIYVCVCVCVCVWYSTEVIATTYAAEHNVLWKRMQVKDAWVWNEHINLPHIYFLTLGWDIVKCMVACSRAHCSAHYLLSYQFASSHFHLHKCRLHICIHLYVIPFTFLYGYTHTSAHPHMHTHTHTHTHFP